jgi:tyrosyl-tRNA synthetase
MNKDVQELLSRSISTVLPSKQEFANILESGRKLRFYVGTDATGPELHLGHSTNYLLLERFRRLGHEIIILFGDFTALIGDPTDKEAARVQLTQRDVEENIKTWKSQVEKIVDFNDPKNPAKILRNSEWLSKLDFENLIDIASSFTVQHMLERDMFEKRMEAGKPVYLHEFFYPLMQGYDSVAMNVDVEVGGTDQTFNMLAGRILQKKYNKKDKFIIATTLLENPITKKKLMSKSEGGYIALNDAPNDMYGKVMALKDEVVRQVFVDCTLLDMSEIAEIMKIHPKEAKMRLAREIVTLYHSKSLAEKAEEDFNAKFTKGSVPADVSEAKAGKDEPLVDILMREGLVKSKTEFNRLESAGAIEEKENGVYRIGKHRFLKILRD